MKNQVWWWVGGVVALVIIAGAAWMLMGVGGTDTGTMRPVTDKEGADGARAGEQMAPQPGKTVQAGGEMISVGDQGAGNSVVVSSVSVSKPSWVAIRDIKGWILGAARVDASRENVTVPLLRNTVAGETYQAIIYIDNGDKAFDFKADALVVASEVAPVSATFNAK